MLMKNTNEQSEEFINTHVASVSCNGKEAPFDHPLIYLKIDGLSKSIACPYCSKKFVFLPRKE